MMIRANRSSQITEGTLVLKIARIEQHLKTLEKQQALSDNHTESNIAHLQTQYQLHQLQQILEYRK